MNGSTYDVRIYAVEVVHGKTTTRYRVRWKVHDKVRRRNFRTSAHAESFRSELRVAARNGEAFGITSGEPVSWAKTKRPRITWYDFVVRYVDMKWKNASAKYRRDIARAMVAATPPLIAGRAPASDREVRSAMYNWGFNTRRREDAPVEVAEVLRWLSGNTRPLQELTAPGVAREVLEAATSRLDGQRAAPDTVRKHRMLLSNAMDYAVELELLESNPIKAIKWTAPARSAVRAVDRRSVINHSQARALLEAVREQDPSGRRLVAFFALIYYSGLRPEEAINVTRAAITLPSSTEQDAWGDLHLTSAAPHAGSNWTNDGALREERALKHRLQGESRPVPVPPPLVAILREHIAAFPDGPGGRLFYGVRSAVLPSTTYMRAWRAARRTALTPQEQASPLARRAYDLRHACVSTWLNAGVPAPQVAEWAGHGTDVLLKIYAKCIDGQDEIAKRRIAAALESGGGASGREAPETQPSGRQSPTLFL